MEEQIENKQLFEFFLREIAQTTMMEYENGISRRFLFGNERINCCNDVPLDS